MMGGNHCRSDEVIDSVQSSAPRTMDRMIGSKAPSYSPLGGEQTQGRNTLSVSMSDNSSSAFNAHSPPYMRRHDGEK